MSRLQFFFDSRYASALKTHPRLPCLIANFMFLGLLGAGCTTPPKAPSTCTQMDWYEIGRQDGASGEPLSVLENHRAMCQASSSSPDIELYTNGRYAGLTEYCTPQTGLESGKAGLEYHKVCPEHLEENFLAAYEVGRRIYFLEVENTDITVRIEQIFDQLSSGKTPPSDQTWLQNKLEELHRMRATNETQINEIEFKFLELL